jgi:DnaJ-class molecular chaperone
VRWTRRRSLLIGGVTSAAGNQSRKGSTVHSAWKRRHDLAEDACPECQGSTYVPGPMYEERMVDACPECNGTGKDATKKAA